MSLPTLSARVDATLDRFELFEADGSRSLALVLKQRYLWDSEGNLERTPGAQIHAVDVPYPDAASARAPSDLVLRKSRVDVIAVGHVVSDHPVKSLDARLEVGPACKSLKVFGPRIWHRSVGVLKPSEPLPFERLPLLWEHAFGGMDVEDPEKLATEPRNPLGRGVVSAAKRLRDTALPQIEDPADLISGSRSHPAPAGLGPLGSNFEPRLSYAGTYDQRWQEERMPLSPADQDPRFHQVAPPELIADLAGAEPIRLLNLGQPGAVEMQLPRLVYQVDALRDGGRQGYRPKLDTVLLDVDASALELTYRVAIALGSANDRLRELRIHEKRRLNV